MALAKILNFLFACFALSAAGVSEEALDDEQCLLQTSSRRLVVRPNATGVVADSALPPVLAVVRSNATEIAAKAPPVPAVPRLNATEPAAKARLPPPPPPPPPSLPQPLVWSTVVIYTIAWFLLTWPHVIPMGRPSTAMTMACLGATIRVVYNSAEERSDTPPIDFARYINADPLILLFGIMIINQYVKDAAFWKHVEFGLESESPHTFLIKVCAASALYSALFMNDTVCFAITPLVLNICERRGVRTALPYLVAISTSANIGSALTPVGNPQNALIASICPGITFRGFVSATFLPVVMGFCVNTLGLWLYFHRDLAFDSEEVPEIRPCDGEGIMSNGANQSTLKPKLSVEAHEDYRVWVYLGLVSLTVNAMVMGFFLGIPAVHVVLLASALMMIFRAFWRMSTGQTKGQTESEFSMQAVDISLLVLFASQFVLVGMLVDTGLPQGIFRSVWSRCSFQLAQNTGCMLWSTVVVMVLSNVITNVPVILMLRPLLEEMQVQDVPGQILYPHEIERLPGIVSDWVLCAWAATIAGNMTMLGSAANLIVSHVAEQRGEHSYTALRVAKYTFVPTLVIGVLGALLIQSHVHGA